MDNPWRHSFHAGIAADNAAYMPDSSLLAASQAGIRRKASPYPPPTLENLSKFRDEAHASNDPQQLLTLAKYMLHTIPHLKIQDRQRAAKVREALTTEAYKTVKKLAKFYPEAMYFLAHSYSTGTTGLVQEKDPGKAFSLYVQGAKQNHAACNYRVAVCYELGAGTKKDKAHAMQFYRKAANLGDTSAMYKLGMILLKGLLGQSKNPREGISWLKRATQSGDEEHPQAMYELGLAYEKEGIPSVIPDIEYSRELFTQSALCGYAPSQFKLGLAYENGFLNCPIDPRRSIAWYSKAAEQGHLEAELALSGWYLTGAEGILQQNDQELTYGRSRQLNVVMLKQNMLLDITLKQVLVHDRIWRKQESGICEQQHKTTNEPSIALHNLKSQVHKNDANTPDQRMLHQIVKMEIVLSCNSLSHLLLYIP